jgi:PP-loop superfamily ATP-utilizing enzyme
MRNKVEETEKKIRECIYEEMRGKIKKEVKYARYEVTPNELENAIPEEKDAVASRMYINSLFENLQKNLLSLLSTNNK